MHKVSKRQRASLLAEFLGLAISEVTDCSHSQALELTQQPVRSEACCTQVHKFSKRQWAALLAEFLGLAIFQIYGGSANDEVAAFGNGITLAILSEPYTVSCTSCCLQLRCWQALCVVLLLFKCLLRLHNPQQLLQGQTAHPMSSSVG